MTKRGLIKKVGVETTLFQGFTPYLDTLLNVRMSLYFVRLQKDENRLVATKGAITLAEIRMNPKLCDEKIVILSQFILMIYKF